MFHAFSPVIVPVFLQMGNSEFSFHLTGSRYFGNSKQNSDYDFMVEDSPEVQQFLNVLGFKKLEIDCYDDAATSVVFNWSQGKQSVDVQCVKNIETKLRAQELLRKMYGCELPAEKSDRRKVWNLALMAVGFAVTP